MIQKERKKLEQDVWQNNYYIIILHILKTNVFVLIVPRYIVTQKIERPVRTLYCRFIFCKLYRRSRRSVQRKSHLFTRVSLRLVVYVHYLRARTRRSRFLFANHRDFITSRPFSCLNQISTDTYRSTRATTIGTFNCTDSTLCTWNKQMIIGVLLSKFV